MTAAPPTIRCAGVVLVEAGRLLLVRRGGRPEQGRWSLPGGRLEAGETPEAGAKREAAEETGLEVEVASLLGVALLAGPGCTYEVFNFAAHRRGGRFAAGSDASELRCVRRAELALLPLSDGLDAWLEGHGVLAWLLD